MRQETIEAINDLPGDGVLSPMIGLTPRARIAARLAHEADRQLHELNLIHGNVISAGLLLPFLCEAIKRGEERGRRMETRAGGGLVPATIGPACPPTRRGTTMSLATTYTRVLQTWKAKLACFYDALAEVWELDLESMDASQIAVPYATWGQKLFDDKPAGLEHLMYEVRKQIETLQNIGFTPDPQPTHGAPWTWPVGVDPEALPPGETLLTDGECFRLGVKQMMRATSKQEALVNTELALDLASMTDEELRQSYGRVADGCTGSSSPSGTSTRPSRRRTSRHRSTA